MSDFDAARPPVRGALTDALARAEAAEAEANRLREILAANLFMQHGSAEAGLEALGGWNEAVGLAQSWVIRSGAVQQTAPLPDDF